MIHIHREIIMSNTPRVEIVSQSSGTGHSVHDPENRVEIKAQMSSDLEAQQTQGRINRGEKLPSPPEIVVLNAAGGPGISMHDPENRIAAKAENISKSQGVQMQGRIHKTVNLQSPSDAVIDVDVPKMGEFERKQFFGGIPGAETVKAAAKDVDNVIANAVTAMPRLPSSFLISGAKKPEPVKPESPKPF